MTTLGIPRPLRNTLRRRRQYWLSAVLGLILIGALGLQLGYTLQERPEPNKRERLNVLVPVRSGDWIGQEEALGVTEMANEAALKTLNLDDYVYRRYARGSRSFTLYAAYWAPGRMPTRLVASHTPDRCWTENGMHCVDMRFRETFQLDGRALLPAEYRAFTGASGGTVSHVAYWHLVGGQLYDYGARFNAVPHPWLWWKDTLAQAAYGSREQLFLRIVSETPLGELWNDRDVHALLAAIANLGLWADALASR